MPSGGATNPSTLVPIRALLRTVFPRVRRSRSGTRDSGVPSAEPPRGYHSVTPRLVVRDVTGAVNFLRAVFDAVGEVGGDRPAEMVIGDSRVLVSSAGARDLFPAFLYVYVDDADRVYQRALAAGAASIEAPRATPYGDRRAMVRDPFGNVFQIAHRPAGGA